ncbi:MAG: GNAT family N-acetyltransferase [Candidatus Omnitrophota bacterium]
MQELVIRPYRQEDRPYVREIAWNTALMGEPASLFFDGKEVFTDFLTRYFTDYEPQSCFVAEVDGKVAGYLLGTRNSSTLSQVFRDKMLLSLLSQAIKKGVFLKKKNLLFFFKFLNSLLRGEFKMPDFSRQYPATLHINLKEEHRGKGCGSKLISAFFDYLLISRVPGVYLATMSEKGACFFQKQGFSLLYKGKRSYFRHVLHKDVPVYIYGKRLA